MPRLHEIESVREVRTPMLPPDEEEAFLRELAESFEPDPSDLAWLSDDGSEFRAAWELASFLPAALDFADWLDALAAQQDRLAASGQPAGSRHAWLARQVRELARRARILHADCPATYDDRDEVLA